MGGELVQWVSLMVLPPARAIVDRYGRFQARHAYLNSSARDPWHRAPAFFGYDADKGDDGMLVDEVRVFVAVSLPYISPISPLHLPYISPVSPRWDSSYRWSPLYDACARRGQPLGPAEG